MVKEPKGREVGHGDTFSFYSDFSEKQFHIKINSIQMKETEEENKKTNDEVGARGRGGGARGESPRRVGQVDSLRPAWLVKGASRSEVASFSLLFLRGAS